MTASSKYGLRAWRLHGSDELVAQTALYSNTVPFSSAGAPTALAIDEESRLEGDDGVVNVTVGFSDGSFTMYQLDISSKQTAVFRIKYVHAMREHVGEITRATSITAMASLGPFLSTVAGHTWSIYEFYGSLPDGTSIGIDVMGVGRGVSNGGVDAVDNDSSSNSRMMQSPHAPKLLTSLRSSTAWPPIALSLRRSINGTLLASIIYAHPLSTSGWSVGMQELRFWTSNGSSDIADNHKTTETALKESRIATAVPSGFTALSNLGDGASPGMSSGRGAGGMATGMDGVSPITGHSGRSQLFDPPLAQPTSLSYCHP